MYINDASVKIIIITIILKSREKRMPWGKAWLILRGIPLILASSFHYYSHNYFQSFSAFWEKKIASLYSYRHTQETYIHGCAHKPSMNYTQRKYKLSDANFNFLLLSFRVYLHPCSAMTANQLSFFHLSLFTYKTGKTLIMPEIFSEQGK